VISVEETEVIRIARSSVFWEEDVKSEDSTVPAGICDTCGSKEDIVFILSFVKPCGREHIRSSRTEEIVGFILERACYRDI
jgi:hypothetical protein